MIIRHCDGPADIVADPNVVTIYNPGQEYERRPLSAYGDRCDWLTPGADLLAEMLTDVGLVRRGDPERLFPVTHGLSPPRAYARLRRLTAALRRNPPPDELLVEESALAILRDVLAAACPVTAPSGDRRRSQTRSRHRRLVERAQRHLAVCYDQPMSLAELADDLHVSAFHLSRVFRRVTGTTVHRYLTQLRLRHTLGPLGGGDVDLTTLGVAAGFSDHSHFSRFFREAFRMTPSAYRRSLRRRVGPPVR